jgi:hypothetical protein
MALNTQYINSSDDKLIQESHTKATATQKLPPIYTQEIKKNTREKSQNHSFQTKHKHKEKTLKINTVQVRQTNNST